MNGFSPAKITKSKFDAIDQRIIDTLQGGFPLVDRPFAIVAEKLAITEEDLLTRLRRLLDEKILTRFGPMFQIEQLWGAFVLATMQVPDSDFDRVAAILENIAAVAHNYRREHRFNMWFVLATETKAGIAETVALIERESGLPVYSFPKEREYFVEMKLPVRPECL